MNGGESTAAEVPRSAGQPPTIPTKTKPRAHRLSLWIPFVWALTAAAVLRPPPAAAQWEKSTDWLLLCSSWLLAELGPDHPNCDDNATYSEGGIKATLDGASLWLEKLGFASPAISARLDLANHYDQAEDDFAALLENALPEDLVTHYDPRCEVRYCAWLVYGLGSLGAYSPEDEALTLDPFPADGETDPGFFGSTEVHELFHAVQAGYPHQQAAQDTDWVEWIIEGSAEHVALAYGASIGLTPGGDRWYRHYDEPLHIPPTEDPDDRKFDSWQYGSWEFFDFLGDYLGSAGGVQYVDFLFENLKAGQKNGLEAVEGVVQHESGAGLFKAFPEFVRQRLVHPCYFSHLGEWDGSDCVEDADNEHRFELTLPDTVSRLHTVADLGANGYVVRMEVPEKEVALLTIEVGPEDDGEHLHLIVHDRLYDEPETFRRRNEYFTLLSPGRHEFFVRLVNAPKDPSSVGTSLFSSDEAAPIEFTLIRQTARALVTGSENAKLDAVLFSYIHPNVDPQTVAAEITPALTERYADHAGLDESTEEGRQAREQIRAAIAEAQPPSEEIPAAPSTPASGRPAQCTAIITLFNDDERAVARLIWEGSGPLLGGAHDVRGTYAHGLHDAIYSTMKQLGQEIALIDDPAAIATWGAEFKNLTVPGVLDLYRARAGQSSPGRDYDAGGAGKLWMAESSGEKVQGAFRFTASGDGGTVAVEGDFTAIPGPIVSRFLRSGCEDGPG